MPTLEVETMFCGYHVYQTTLDSKKLLCVGEQDILRDPDIIREGMYLLVERSLSVEQLRLTNRHLLLIWNM